VDVNATIGNGVVGHVTTVSADVPVFVERPMYFTRAVGDDGVVINGGHVAFGADPGVSWSFAEGTVLPDFAEYLTLGNPNAVPVNVKLTYLLGDGSTIVRTAPVAAGSRHTVKVFDGSGDGIGRDVSDPLGRGVSIVVESPDGPIVAERPMYFHHDFGLPAEVNDGHDVVGVTAPATTWRFADGTTMPDFYDFLTIGNPNSQPATVAITYFTDGSGPTTVPVTVPATSRVTVQIYGPASQGGIGRNVTGFSIRLDSDHPVLVELPEYLIHGIPGIAPTINGGSSVIGQPGS
jgi:hypothetical protein